ncbi:hypothetical protein AMECASPLE_030074, partial [Ameca splendens]
CSRARCSMSPECSRARCSTSPECSRARCSTSPECSRARCSMSQSAAEPARNLDLLPPSCQHRRTNRLLFLQKGLMTNRLRLLVQVFKTRGMEPPPSTAPEPCRRFHASLENLVVGSTAILQDSFVVPSFQCSSVGLSLLSSSVGLSLHPNLSVDHLTGSSLVLLVHYVPWPSSS